MAGVVELPDWEIKASKINRLRAIIDNRRPATDRQWKQRDGNPKK